MRASIATRMVVAVELNMTKVLRLRLPNDLIAEHLGAATSNVGKSQHPTRSRFA